MASRADLLARGYTRRSIERALASGTLRRIRTGLYATAPTCGPVDEAARHGGVLACASAARHLGIWTVEDARLHVWMRPRGNRGAHAGCACVEHWDAAPPGDPPDFVSAAQALRQILTCLGVEAFFVALESALHRNLLTRADLAWLRTHATPEGREALTFARRDAESGLESLLRWRLRGRGLRLRSQVTIVSVGRVDFLLGDRLIIEVDGKPNHDGPSMRHKDLVRDAQAAAWGYTTLRFDYAMVVHDWDLVEAAILRAVDAGAHLFP